MPEETEMQGLTPYPIQLLNEIVKGLKFDTLENRVLAIGQISSFMGFFSEIYYKKFLAEKQEAGADDLIPFMISFFNEVKKTLDKKDIELLKGNLENLCEICNIENTLEYRLTSSDETGALMTNFLMAFNGANENLEGIEKTEKNDEFAEILKNPAYKAELKEYNEKIMSPNFQNPFDYEGDKYSWDKYRLYIIFKEKELDELINPEILERLAGSKDKENINIIIDILYYFSQAKNQLQDHINTLDLNNNEKEIEILNDLKNDFCQKYQYWFDIAKHNSNNTINHEGVVQEQISELEKKLKSALNNDVIRFGDPVGFELLNNLRIGLKKIGRAIIGIFTDSRSDSEKVINSINFQYNRNSGLKTYEKEHNERINAKKLSPKL